MIHAMYSVFDTKSKTYTQPFLSINADVAIRSFANAVNEPGHTFGKNPEDFTLFYVGSFDDMTSAIDPAKEMIITALEVQNV